MVRINVFTAAYVLPITREPIRDGALAVSGDRIVAVGSRAEVAAQVSRHETVETDLGDVAILPGLVNAHTHLELSWAAGALSAAGDWVSWVGELVRAREAVDPDVAREAAVDAIASVVARGTVAVGDIANATWIRPLLQRSGLAGIAFHEIYGLDAATPSEEHGSDGDGLPVVMTPHAPHTTSAERMQTLARRAAQRGLPFSIHLAESEAECAWLAEGTGPLESFYRRRGFVAADWRPPGLRPVAYLDRLGLLGPRTLAVHCVQVDDDDLALLDRSGATVVTCPRSNRRLGVGVAPVPAMLARGIPVALGTDSLASSPDLDLFAELHALVEQHPTLTPGEALRCATLGGARALGIDDRFGALQPGHSANVLVVPLPQGCTDPARFLCSRPQDVGKLDADGYGVP